MKTPITENITMKSKTTMKTLICSLTTSAVLALCFTTVRAASEPVKLEDAIALFRNAGQSGSFFHHCYGYAIFPTVGEGAFIVGGAGGKGAVFVHGRQIGEATLAQVSIGFQAGGQAYSEIIFFENKGALDEFESGDFEFGADASVVAITAAANAGASTNGAESGASGGEKDARTTGHYYKGMAVFTIAKGGLMYQAAVAGQKFKFRPLAAS
ncbi:MAG TPA: YSC84-related protein [Steroidobacteraceae bacterium]|nr:YSC84-related protein [Steroidobacteraceae bacterium]